MTGFVRGRQSDEGLKLSMDRKVSPAGRWQGPWRDRPGRWVPTVPNSFGLPSGVTCPGKTEFCRSCYGINAERSPGVAELLGHNLRLLARAGTRSGMARLLDDMIVRYLAETVRQGVDDRLFRIHWDGDFFSEPYAWAWGDVIGAHPDIRFWAYTRSFAPPVDVVPILSGWPNLALYLSADRHNIAAARRWTDGLPHVRLALCGDDYDTARGLVPEQRTAICPENARRVPLMTEGRGACVTCGICPSGTSDIVFSTSHRMNLRAPSLANPATAGPPEPGTKACEWCGTAFTLRRARGRVPRFCCRAHQVAAYRAKAT